MRCLRSYPSALCSGNNLLTQIVPAAKSDNPIPSARPSTENVGGLFSSIHPIKKEVMHYDKTESRAVYYEKGDAFAEKALALPEVKGLLMEAVNEHNKNEFGGD